MCSLPAIAEPGAFVIGGGIEADSEDGVALTMLGDISIADDTWLSAAVARSTVDIPRGDDSDTWYADVGVDHYFDPAGIRLGVAYWGDSETLDSTDARMSFYSRGDRSYLSVQGEYRNFDLVVPAFGPFQGGERSFSANGLGLSGRLDLTDDVSVRASGMSYEYDGIQFDVPETNRVVDLLSVSRLSLLSSLVDWRASVGVDVDFGLSRLSFDVSRWAGAIADDNYGATVSYLVPVSQRTDVEISLGYDDSELFGEVTILSFFVYFYGGD